MKLPTNLQSQVNKVRDSKILSLTLDGMTSQEVADWLIEHKHYHGVGKRENVASLVRKVIYRNKASLKIDRDYENLKQTIRARRKAENSADSKTALGWEYLLDAKIGSKNTDGGGNGSTKIIIIRPEAQANKDIADIKIVRPAVQEAINA